MRKSTVVLAVLGSLTASAQTFAPDEGLWRIVYTDDCQGISTYTDREPLQGETFSCSARLPSDNIPVPPGTEAFLDIQVDEASRAITVIGGPTDQDRRIELNEQGFGIAQLGETEVTELSDTCRSEARFLEGFFFGEDGRLLYSYIDETRYFPVGAEGCEEILDAIGQALTDGTGTQALEALGNTNAVDAFHVSELNTLAVIHYFDGEKAD